MARYLYQRNGIWHFKKRLKGTKKMKRCSLHTRDLEVAIRKRDALLQKNSLLNEWDYGLDGQDYTITSEYYDWEFTQEDCVYINSYEAVDTANNKIAVTIWSSEREDKAVRLYICRRKE